MVAVSKGEAITPATRIKKLEKKMVGRILIIILDNELLAEYTKERKRRNLAATYRRCHRWWEYSLNTALNWWIQGQADSAAKLRRPQSISSLNVEHSSTKEECLSDISWNRTRLLSPPDTLEFLKDIGLMQDNCSDGTGISYQRILPIDDYNNKASTQRKVYFSLNSNNVKLEKSEASYINNKFFI